MEPHDSVEEAESFLSKLSPGALKWSWLNHGLVFFRRDIRVVGWLRAAPD